MCKRSVGIFAITEMMLCITLPAKSIPLIVSGRAKGIYKDSFIF